MPASKADPAFHRPASLDPLFDAVNLAIFDLDDGRPPHMVARKLREAVRQAERAAESTP